MIVTIGRQNGSGGREVGRILAEKMGVPCYDREIVEETARRSGRSIDEVERQEEVAHSESRLYFGGVPPASHMFEEQAAVIRDLASNGPCVFVGRSADYILRDRDDVISVFITAPVPDRIKRSAARNGISEKNAYERITTKDRARSEYCRRYTGRVWGDASNYNLAVNTGPIGVDAAVEMVLEYIRRMSS